jgi:hypothetical protein
LEREETMSDKCPKCGAGMYSSNVQVFDSTAYRCGTIIKDKDSRVVVFGHACLRNQLAQRDALLDEIENWYDDIPKKYIEIVELGAILAKRKGGGDE